MIGRQGEEAEKPDLLLQDGSVLPRDKFDLCLADPVERGRGATGVLVETTIACEGEGAFDGRVIEQDLLNLAQKLVFLLKG